MYQNEDEKRKENKKNKWVKTYLFFAIIKKKKEGEKMEESIEKLAQYIKEAKTITVFTGAGMSTESGIPDFRSATGIWEEDGKREYYISKSYYQGYPKDFWIKFKDIFSLKMMGRFQPNSGHLFLKELEEMGKNVHILTQNIDGLHEKAGSTDILNLHGTLQTATCPKCKRSYNLTYVNDAIVPRCKKSNAKGKICDFILKPDVVLYGDAVNGYEQALEKAYDADLFLTLGSSLKVYPVNQLPMMLSRAPGIKKVIINKESTRMDRYFDMTIHQSIGETIKAVKTYL